MTDTAINVDHLSKRYRIGLKEEMHDSLGSAIGDFISQPVRNLRRLRRLSNFGRGQSDSADVIWALSDVTFSAERGQVLGIIGENGAGKSTLLKILSRITEPSEGSITLNGRVSSLLEVGTGFHPELTGRENVFLNGAILGMTRGEIKSKFDEIVDFSGVEKFIDTPVKRYSSGMKVRLAFAVAAHLEPEVLLVDEVLAVGDVAFQNKCIGKMEDVSKSGRTILFVSHNMPAVQALCDRCIVLEGGRIVFDGTSEAAIVEYVSKSMVVTEGVLNDTEERDGDGRARFTNLRVDNGNGGPTGAVYLGDNLRFCLDFDCDMPVRWPSISVIVKNHLGYRMIAARSHITMGELPEIHRGGAVSCTIPSPVLVPGTYSVTISMYDAEVHLVDRLRDVRKFTIAPTDIYGTGKLPRASDSLLSPPVSWSHDYN